MKIDAGLQQEVLSEVPEKPNAYATNTLANLSFAQLEGALIAANIMLDVWRTSPLSDCAHLGELCSRGKKSALCS